MGDERNPYFRWPIDAIAPYSYEMLFVRAPLDAVVETLSQESVGRHEGVVTSNYWSLHQDDMVAPLSDWPALLALGVRDDRERRRVVVAETKNDEWVAVLVTPTEVHNGLLWRVRRGVHAPAVPDAIAVEVVRDPDTRTLSEHAQALYPGGMSIGLYGKTNPDRPPEAIEYGAGIVWGERGLRSAIRWPDDPDYRFAAIDRLAKKKVRVRNRFTHQDLAEACGLFGLHLADEDFFTGRVVNIYRGYPLPSVEGTQVFDEYRDDKMPGWRE
ncbi:hypothetical protein ACT3SZ_12565 [Corynebacterium sp. AOP40-9SA-29]|uniref:hypothetical protein n=1 Tax=Corynebacterium sp. AOP40-9SA-29 TaxID=3457677 RepID=UPI0040341C4B